MKKNIFIISIYTSILLLACESNSSKNTIQKNEGNYIQTDIDTPSKINEKEKTVTSFLITNHSVGYFNLDSPWQEYAKNNYNLKFVQSFGTCVDACCDGGFDLGKMISLNEGKQVIENPDITIGAKKFDDSESNTKHKNNPDVFYTDSPNCNAWYWKNKISYLMIYSDLFHTAEGIGVGVSLEQIQEKFGKLTFYIGWVEEDPNAIQVILKPYPNLKLIIDEADYKGNVENINLEEFENNLNISDFKTNTKIQRIIVRKDETDND